MTGHADISPGSDIRNLMFLFAITFPVSIRNVHNFMRSYVTFSRKQKMERNGLRRINCGRFSIIIHENVLYQGATLGRLRGWGCGHSAFRVPLCGVLLVLGSKLLPATPISYHILG